MQLPTATRENLADALDALIGAGGSARLQNAAQTATYATCNLDTPAFGDAATGVITLAGTPTDSSAAVGTVERLGFYDAVTGGALVMSMSVNDTGTPDIDISNNSLQNGDQIEITAAGLTVTVPAGTFP